MGRFTDDSIVTQISAAHKFPAGYEVTVEDPEERAIMFKKANSPLEVFINYAAGHAVVSNKSEDTSVWAVNFKSDDLFFNFCFNGGKSIYFDKNGNRLEI
jgi:hypothetical protein